jgi:hypothetical protein
MVYKPLYKSEQASPSPEMPFFDNFFDFPELTRILAQKRGRTLPKI